VGACDQPRAPSPFHASVDCQFDEEVRLASPATRRALGPAAVAYSALHTPPRDPGYDRHGASVLEPHPPGLKMGMIRFPSTFRRPSPSDTRAALEAAAAHAAASEGGGGAPERQAGGGQGGEGGGLPGRSPPGSGRGFRLKQQPLGKQLASGEFRSATALLTVASFWANFYIGAVDLQVTSPGGKGPSSRQLSNLVLPAPLPARARTAPAWASSLSLSRRRVEFVRRA
jgi:hypothetical protein